MTIELTMLVYSVILAFILILIPATEAIKRNGAMAQAGPRDNLPEPSVFHKRASRLSVNMLENLALFAPLVLVAHAAGISTANTVLGAEIFFYARIVHAGLYLFAVPAVRPLAWLAGVIGMGMIAMALI